MDSELDSGVFVAIERRVWAAAALSANFSNTLGDLANALGASGEAKEEEAHHDVVAGWVGDGFENALLGDANGEPDANENGEPCSFSMAAMGSIVVGSES